MTSRDTTGNDGGTSTTPPFASVRTVRLIPRFFGRGDVVRFTWDPVADAIHRLNTRRP